MANMMRDNENGRSPEDHRAKLGTAIAAGRRYYGQVSVPLSSNVSRSVSVRRWVIRGTSKRCFRRQASLPSAHKRTNTVALAVFFEVITGQFVKIHKRLDAPQREYLGRLRVERKLASSATSRQGAYELASRRRRQAASLRRPP